MTYSDSLPLEYPGICEAAFGIHGVSKDDAARLYDGAIRMFGNDLADQIETKFLLPMAVRKVAEVQNLKMTLATRELIFINHLNDVLHWQRNFWTWLLNEEVRAMKSMIDGGEESWDEAVDAQSHMHVLQWFLGKLPDKLAGRSSGRLLNIGRRLQSLVGGEDDRYDSFIPDSDTTQFLEHVQVIFRAWVERVNQSVNPGPVGLLQQSLEPYADEIDLPKPYGLPQRQAPVVSALCAVRFCMYLLYSIEAVDDHLKK